MHTFNLFLLTPVMDHLKRMSPNMGKKLSNEYMCHCPFCDDAIRKNALKHGHLYLSSSYPVFNCFRCNTSGTLISLLLQTGFDDQSVIDFISQFIKINVVKDYYKKKDFVNLADKIKSVKKQIIDDNINFRKNNYNDYKIFKNYLNNRIGNNINYLDFLLTPTKINNDIIVKFTNYIGENVLVRYINNNKLRYKINNNTSNLYYFQNINRYNSICICEGPFDIINLYLYNDIFKDCLFISINGKNYINNIEKLILMYFLLDEYEIKIVFDNDNLNKGKKDIKIINKITEFYGGKIRTRFFKPLNEFNDVAEFPEVEEIVNV